MMDGIGKPPDDELDYEVWRQTSVCARLIAHAAGGDKKRDDS